MKSLSKSLKVKISLSILWGVLTLLMAGLSADNYSGFSLGTFLIVLIALNFPILIYWLGFWIWGEGYIFKALARVYKFLSFKKFIGLIAALLVAGIVVVFLHECAEVLGLGAMTDSQRMQRNLDAIGNIILLIIAVLAGAKVYRKIVKGKPQEDHGNEQTKKSLLFLLVNKSAIIFTLYIVALIWLSYAIDAFTVNGVSYTLGQGTGAFIGAYFVVWIISKVFNILDTVQSRSHAAAFLAIFVLVSGELKTIEDTRDARIFMSEIKDVTPENFIQVIQRSETRIGRSISAVVAEVSEAQEVFLTLDDERFSEALAPETLRSSKKLSALLEVARQKKIDAQEAPAKRESIYQSALSKREALSSRMPASAVEPFWNGFIKSYNEDKDLAVNWAKAYEDFYASIIGLYETLLSQEGAYLVASDSFVTFEESSAVDAYNQYIASLIKSVERIEEIAQKVARKNESLLKQMHFRLMR